MVTHAQHVSHNHLVHLKKRAVAYFVCAVLLLLADLLFITSLAKAAPAYTPYANSVASESGISSGQAENAVGAPDGQTAGLLSVNSTLTLDMGVGEEGTQTAKLYFGSINVSQQVNVSFLDGNQGVIKQEARSLFLNTSASTANFSYDWRDFGKAYRFVRITSTAGGGLNLDAVEALGFIGSTASQDTDGDGIPDRQDAQPLVFNTSGGGGGGGNTPLPVNRSVTNTTNTTNTTQVNNPPSPTQDTDGDQLPDVWEIQFGLNPNQNDANGDPDHDDLNNLEEYKLGTDPNKRDTDGDGMPDGWEVKYGLNPLKIDGDQDPDGDYLTNLGEYHFGTHPLRANKVSVDSNDACLLEDQGQLTDMDWLIFYLLLTAAGLSLATALILAAAPAPTEKSSKNYRFRHRLYRAFRPRSHRV